MNTLQHSPQHRLLGRSGRGLGMHRRIITSMHGLLCTTVDDGVWILRAEIPITTQSTGIDVSTSAAV